MLQSNMEKMKMRYMKPLMEMIQVESMKLLDESLPLFEEEITDSSEIE